MSLQFFSKINVGMILTSAVTILIAAIRLKRVRQVMEALIGRIYLNLVILPGKAGGSDQASTREDSAIITGLFIHPIKSLKSVSLETAVLGEKGFAGDRQYMLVTPNPIPLWGSFGPGDATHRFLSQRRCPILTQISVQLNENKNRLEISSTILPNQIITIDATPPSNNSKYLATIWSDTVQVQDMGDDIASFFTSIIQLDKEFPDEYKKLGVRLVVQCPDDNRIANDKYIPGTARSLLTGNGPKVALSDGFPM
jgi:uncharacterized protein